MNGESYMKKRVPTILIAVLLLSCAASTVSAATLGKTLQNKLNGAAANTQLGVVIVSFNTTKGLNDSHLDILKSIGVVKGITPQHLGMVAIPATVAQVSALAGN